MMRLAATRTGVHSLHSGPMPLEGGWPLEAGCEPLALGADKVNSEHRDYVRQNSYFES